MPISNWKFQILSAGAGLVLLAGAIGCKGFFVNPTLTTLTVTPVNPSLELGQQLQMVATGTYDDGSTSTNVKSLSWTISPTTDATISSSTGLVTPVAVSTSASTITASSGAVSGTTTITVVLANVTSITVAPSSSTAIIGGTAGGPFTATANVQGQSPVDITGSATWQVVQNGTVATSIQCTYIAPSEQCSALSGATAGTYSINVTYAGTNAVGTATLTVAQ